jgi:hypothetical protein
MPHASDGAECPGGLLDLLTALWLTLLWRPLALLLIYSELLLRASLLALRALLVRNRWALPLLAGAGAAAYACAPPAVLTCTLAGVLSYLLAASLRAAPALSDWRLTLELLATLPCFGAAIELRRRRRLLDYSLMYRLSQHLL